MNYLLTKSKYLSGLQCPKRLWLEVYDPAKATPPSLAQQHLFELGKEVGLLAQTKFENGVLIEPLNPRTSMIQTQSAIEKGERVLFEGGFLFDDIFVRVDILKRNDDGTWDIIEVKQSTRLKDENIPDVAIQKYVVEGAGYRIDNSILMHINNECTYPELNTLFTLENIGERVNNHYSGMNLEISNQKEVLSQSVEHKVNIGRHCEKPYPCPFQEYCWNDVPKKSIFTIPRLHETKLSQLMDQSILAIEDLPGDFPLTGNQQNYVELIKNGHPEIDLISIKRELSGLTFPLYFLDFETYSTPIPQFAGLHPYSRLPFQYSCHVLDSDGNMVHYEYLHQGKDDPRQYLIESLLKNIGNTGSVIVYNANFEKNILKELASHFTQYSNQLLAIESRIWDQLDIFRNYYKHPDFVGSNSIKDVLPVIQPSLSHKALDLQKGDDAGAMWIQMLNLYSSEYRDKLIQDLKAYCELDTFAMVEIHKHLNQMACQ